MAQETEADADEREHEVEAEEVAVRELGATACKAEADNVRLRRARERQRGEVERDVEQVVRGDRECNNERLTDLLAGLSWLVEILRGRDAPRRR